MENQMNRRPDDLSTLPMNTFQDVPTPHADAQRIVALVKEAGRVSGYQLSDGRILTRDEGVRLAREGKIQDVGVAVNQGTEYLRSLPDASEDNNLGNLPSMTREQGK